jgi:hypothetical protein
VAFNGSGVHNRVHDWTQDLANTIPVTASRMDAEHDDISAALSNCICRDGQSTTTARISFAQGTSATAGSASAVAYAQTNDPNTGMYFPNSDQWGLVAGGTATLTSTTTKVTAQVAVDFGAIIAPTSSDGAALGSASQMWSDLFLASGAVVNFNNGDATITHSSNTLAIAGCTVTFDTAPTPATSDGAALGTASVMWSDLFLASGAVISFNNGDVTLTHSANNLNVAGGTFSVDGNTVSGVLPTRQVLTSGTGATYTTPAGARQLRIRMVGGGGGGGAETTNTGGGGSATSFGGFQAAGGSGGVHGNADTPLGGLGGTGGAGAASLRMAGSPGGSGLNGTGGTNPQPCQSGSGGAGPFGGNGRSVTNGFGGDSAIANSGAGGSGAASGNGGDAGGGGGAGEYVEIIINSPDATYSYTIGAGGNGGAAGARAGGNGGSGIVIVDEYY